MSTPARAWCLNHVLRDAQNVCALTKVGTVLKNELNWSFYFYFFFVYPSALRILHKVIVMIKKSMRRKPYRLKYSR